MDASEMGGFGHLVARAVVLTAKIGQLAEEGKHVHSELGRICNLAQHMHRQLQKVPRGMEPDAARPIVSVLGSTLEVVEGLCHLRVNSHGYFNSSMYGHRLQTMERRLGDLAEILSAELALSRRDLVDGPATPRSLHEIIPDVLAREFWRVAFGRNVAEVPAGQFFACIERMIDGGDWLNFACLSQALDPQRAGRVELAAFAEFAEREGGLVRGLHKYAMAPTMVYACGSNRMGECGQPALLQDHFEEPVMIEVLKDRTVRQIACDSGFSAAVLDNGELYTWGSNSYGKLGHGAHPSASADGGASAARPVASCAAPRLVHSLEGIPIDQVECGSTFAAAVSRDGMLYTWGGYSAHERHSPTLGHDPNTTPALAAQLDPFSTAGVGGTIAHHGARDTTPCLSTPTRVETLKDLFISQVSCGTEHAACITNEGKVLTWGGGERGKLGLGSGNEEDAYTPQPVVGLDDKRVCQVSCGAFHTLSVTTDGTVYAWGSGKDGKLGLGDVAYCPYFERDNAGQPFVAAPHLVTQLATRNTVVTQVSAGSAHSAAVTESGEVFTWGCGKSGKLGHGASLMTGTTLSFVDSPALVCPGSLY